MRLKSDTPSELRRPRSICETWAAEEALSTRAESDYCICAYDERDLIAAVFLALILDRALSLSWLVLTHRVEDAELSAILETSFKTRLIEIMDQSQHSLADHGGEGAAYEFAQGLDSWEKERKSQAVPRWC